MTINCYQQEPGIPHSLGAAELVFLTKLARVATRQKIVPAQIVMTQLPNNLNRYEDFFGEQISRGDCNAIAFSPEDSVRPFLTENIGMWDFFESGLRQRLVDLETAATSSQRVKTVLLDMLPSGQSSMDNVARQCR